jgi:hypothetical protein
MKTKGFVKDAPLVGLSSRNTETMKVNEDGSYDVYFSPEAPNGHEENWIPTGKISFCCSDCTDLKVKLFTRLGVWVI